MSEFQSVLAEAGAAVNGPRQGDYGHPAHNHARTAAMWSAYLGVPITPRQVCILNVLQKCARDANRPIRDNLVDIAGWAENGEMVAFPPEKAPESHVARESAWLIESHLHHSPMWFAASYSGIGGWHADSNAALRFSRRADAEDALGYLRAAGIIKDPTAIAIEHTWVVGA